MLVGVPFVLFWLAIWGSLPELYGDGIRVVNPDFFSLRGALDIPYGDVSVTETPAWGFEPGGPARHLGCFELSATRRGRVVYRASFSRHQVTDGADLDHMFEAFPASVIRVVPYQESQRR